MKNSRIIKKNHEFDRVYKRGKPRHGAQLSLFFVKRKTDGPSRFGVTVARKVKGAVKRNRVKRVLRELLRKHSPHIKDGYDIILMGKSEAPKGSFADLSVDLEKTLKGAKLWQDFSSAPVENLDQQTDQNLMLAEDKEGLL